MLDAIKEPDCIYILQRILDKYPYNKELVWYAKNNMNTLRNKYNVK